MYVRYEGHLLKKEVHFLPVLQKRERKTSFILMRLKFLQQNRLKLTSMEVYNQQLVLTVTSTNPIACCPVCQTASRQVHLYREIRRLGYDGCRSVVTNYVSQLRQQAGVKAMTGRKKRRQPKLILRQISGRKKSSDVLF